MYQNQFIYSRERRRFGRQCRFQDRNELMVSVQPSGRQRLKYIMRNPSMRATQLSCQMALTVMETENVTLDQHGMYHYEGGWPKEVNPFDEEQTQRHRKKVEREDSWGEQVLEMIRNTMAVAEQNNTLNIYQNFFADLPLDLGHDLRMRFRARVANVFHDLWLPSRRLTSIEWMPNNSRQFMTQFTNQFQSGDRLRSVTDEPFGEANAFYVWDVKNPLKPKIFHDSKLSVSLAKICPKDENNMVGGTGLGQVCVWNTFKGGLPVRNCPLEVSHRETTSALCWVHSKSNTEFYSGSLDGSIKYWDTRDLKMPMQELLLEPEPQERQSRMDSHGVTVLEFEYTIPVRFIICSDMGHVFVGNRKGMTPTETLLAHYQLFAGPVRSINRNPFFVKNFLVTGDWRARIWSEEVKDAPSTMYFRKKTQILCGAWSTGRCSLFVTGDMNGVVDFWDLLLHHRQPILSIDFKVPIADVVFRPEGDLLAIALKNGDSHILTLDESMRQATGKEKALIAAMFEREIVRSKLLEARYDEVRLKRKTLLLAEEDRLRQEQAVAPVLELDPDNPDQFVLMIEGDEEFRTAISEFQDMILGVERKRSKRQVVMERTVFEEWNPTDEKLQGEPIVYTQPEPKVQLSEKRFSAEPRTSPGPAKPQ
ncbi:dynein intermediate chain 3, ciliary [Drosophila biarmipes]|uniref:dynein intermediate chain 3, ciliary n=1 Tax=Drosophila biarmipes TaxID=125945 RepID=UPI0007E76802|nr:dynein intermediate chain 3, ciliary [Drosophila biarmipes]XP_050744487.1 dynein intermediate chain 3, ciliary [Drosophila biarmipes]